MAFQTKKLISVPVGGGDQRFCLGISIRRPAMTCISNVFVVEFISQGVLSINNGLK